MKLQEFVLEALGMAYQPIRECAAQESRQTICHVALTSFVHTL